MKRKLIRYFDGEIVTPAEESLERYIKRSRKLEAHRDNQPSATERAGKRAPRRGKLK